MMYVYTPKAMVDVLFLVGGDRRLDLVHCRGVNKKGTKLVEEPGKGCFVNSVGIVGDAVGIIWSVWICEVGSCPCLIERTQRRVIEQPKSVS